ncbi:MAG: polysaccharide pyruvyl transferase family protein [Eubacteriales bacterium]|nr:polysaccharide pyruvyl transferase family protein [Eubacteriales bacterium]
MINRVFREVYSMVYSNKIILNYPSVKQHIEQVNLHCFDADKTLQDNINLGDHLSGIVVNWMLREKGLSLETCIGTKDKHNLYAIGSILLMGYQNATVWGSGLPFKPSLLRGLFHTNLLRSLDIRAVRGPYTRKVLLELGHKCPDVYGDPAVLMPMIYKQTTMEKTQDYIVIPHFSTYVENSTTESNNDVISMHTTNYKSVIDRICRSRIVISSSLHGIILAESYGVPAIFYQDRPERFNFKYYDWYKSTGREVSIAHSVEEAKHMEPMMPPNLNSMRGSLLETFPYDLWIKR